jgi:hypothetical protein
MHVRHALGIALCVVLANTVLAQEDPKAIRLICTYSYSIDDKGERSGTSGEELFTVLALEGGRAVIRKQGLSAPFFGTVSDEEIAGEANYEVENIKLAESLSINRFTGQFQLSFGAAGKRVIHFGKCRSVTKQLF